MHFELPPNMKPIEDILIEDPSATRRPYRGPSPWRATFPDRPEDHTKRTPYDHTLTSRPKHTLRWWRKWFEANK